MSVALVFLVKVGLHISHYHVNKDVRTICLTNRHSTNIHIWQERNHKCPISKGSHYFVFDTMYCWVNLELFDASGVASTCSLRNPRVLSGEHILRQFPGTHLAGTGTKPGKNESSRVRSYCGVKGVSVLTRDHDDLFADIMTVERTMFSPFLASSGQVFGESLPLPIVYIAAALVVVC